MPAYTYVPKVCLLQGQPNILAVAHFADQLTLLQPGGADSAHPLLPASPKNFTFRHH